MTETEAIHKIWAYMRMGHQLRKADMLFVLCSYDLRVAERAAEVWHMGLAPLVTISGGGHLKGLTGDWNRSEAEEFADVMERAAVPREKMLLETQSENTGDNAKLSLELWREKGLDPNVIIAVQKPFMERRTYATLKVWMSDKEIIVTSPQVSFEDWVAGGDVDRKRTMDIAVGDLYRIKEYPARGFQIHQDIPDDVWAAYEFLTEKGYGRAVRPGPETKPTS
jgi:uncharacterized SAM-binding protein YcdF (DUF218 family)